MGCGVWGVGSRVARIGGLYGLGDIMKDDTW